MTIENEEKTVSLANIPNTIVNNKLSVISVVCRICYDNEKGEELIAPCRCKGTVAFVHRTCLETWLAESNSTACELCHQIFKTERTPRYSTSVSIWRWLINGRRGFGGGDILSCTVLTPLAVVITYICLYSSEYYSQKRFSNVPAARWTSVSLLFMIGIMLLGYYLWVYSVIRIHARMWYNWWQRSCDVRYIATSNIELCNRQEINVSVPNNTPANDEIAVVVDEDLESNPENQYPKTAGNPSVRNISEYGADSAAGAVEQNEDVESVFQDVTGDGEHNSTVILIEEEIERYSNDKMPDPKQ